MSFFGIMSFLKNSDITPQSLICRGLSQFNSYVGNFSVFLKNKNSIFIPKKEE